MYTIPNIPPNASPDIQNSILNQVIDAINLQQRTQVLSDKQTSRFLFGFQANGWPGGDFGIKISRPGKDVTTAGLTDLLFYWDFTTGTQYWNDGAGVTYRQDGLLPDNTYGWAIARSGTNVQEAFS